MSVVLAELARNVHALQVSEAKFWGHHEASNERYSVERYWTWKLTCVESLVAMDSSLMLMVRV